MPVFMRQRAVTSKRLLRAEESSSKMRIVIAGQTYFPSSNGQAVFTVHLAEGLAALGHQVMAIAPSECSRPCDMYLNGVRVRKMRAIHLGPNDSWDTYLNLPAGRTVDRLLNEFKPDIVHIQDHYPLSRVAVFTARKRRLPLVGTNHFLPQNVLHLSGLPAWITRRLERPAWFWVLELYNRLDVVTTPTETAAGILRQQHIRAPVYAISCGVDQKRFYPDQAMDRVAMRLRYGLNPESILFMFVGRLDQEKRIDVLLRAMSQLQRSDVQLVVVGHGRHEAPLLALAEQLQLGKRVVFTGYLPREDLPGLLNSADVFTMPSEAELQSIATLEAMACGKPILAANARALPELVKDGVNGYLFTPGDHEDAIRRILQLADERDRLAEMGAASLARVSLHSLSRTVQWYETLYASLNPTPRPIQSLPSRQPVTERT
jgi:glycosyltransferase involved in cell wall biosynthesis